MLALAVRLESQSFEVFGLLTLFVMTVYGPGDQFHRMLVGALFAAALLFRELLTNWLFWLAVSGSTLVTLVAYWGSGADYYLYLYWGLSILVVLLTETSEVGLRKVMRLLVGSSFLVAAISKCISPDFLSGAFYEYFLLTDMNRIAPVGILFTELDLQTVISNEASLQNLPSEVVQLESVSGIRQLAQLLTYLTLIVETSVAIGFLFNFSKWLREGSLLVFLVGTYLVAPVVAFGVSYAVMGFAQTESLKLKATYLILFFTIQFTPARSYIMYFLN